jgi:hypothetical protein
MVTTPVPVPDPAKPGAPAPAGLGAWFKRQNKTTYYAAGAGIVVAIGLYVKSRKSTASSAASSTPAASTTSSDGYAYPGGIADTSGTDYGTYASDLEGQISGLSTQIAALAPTSPAPAPTPTPSATPAPSYSLIGTDVADTVQTDLNEGVPVDYAFGGNAPEAVTQPTPGGGWYAGGNPIGGQGNPSGAPGQGQGFYTLSGPGAATPAPNVALS